MERRTQVDRLSVSSLLLSKIAKAFFYYLGRLSFFDTRRVDLLVELVSLATCGH